MNSKILRWTKRPEKKIPEIKDVADISIEKLREFLDPAMENKKIPKPLERRNAINISLNKKEEIGKIITKQSQKGKILKTTEKFVNHEANL